MIVFLKQIDIEGPETIGAFFKKKGFTTKTVELYNGDKVPDDFDAIDAVVVLGGPMNVYEEDKHFFLKDEDIFIKEILKRNIPFLGICLGSQLLAKASGATIGPSPEKEIGFSTIELNDSGQNDPLFRNTPPLVNVFQWHQDMSDVPSGGTLLASSAQCPHQAFKVGVHAYGLQFHVEITDKSIRQWSDRYFKEDQMHEKQIMLDDYFLQKKRFEKTALTLYENFLRIIQNAHSPSSN